MGEPTVNVPEATAVTVRVVVLIDAVMLNGAT
jgi:hypothetical protein